MKWLVDAQLPNRVAILLRSQGHDVLHTRDLPEGNSTSDEQIIKLAVQENRIVITKDRDFLDSFLLKGEPEKLLLISTGNIRNSELESLLSLVLPDLVSLFLGHRYVELTRTTIIVHQ